MMETTEASRTPFLPELENLGPAPVPHDRPALSRLQSFYERAKDTTKLYLAFEPYEDVSFPLVPKALFVLGRDNPVRKLCARVVTWRPFDHFMLAVIVANCITLAMASNRPGFDDTTLGQGLRLANYVFIGLFAAEAAIKIVALGFVLAPGTYLRNGWNVLDFAIVCVSFLEFTPVGANSTAVRSVRVLRPLRTITKIPQLKLIVMTLIRSVPMLFDVLMLAAFYFTVFGVTTVQIYAGKLSGRCGSPDFSQAVQDPSTGVLTGVTYTVASADTGDVCSAPDTLSLVWANTSGVPIPISGINTNQGQGNVCPWSAGPPDPNAPGSWCAPWGNPSEGGQRNFDNILSAWLAIFQTVTLTDWVYIMYDCQDAVSWWVFPLHMAMAVLGSFFLLSLALAVLYLFFVKDRKEQEEAAEKAMANLAVQAELEQRRKGHQRPHRTQAAIRTHADLSAPGSEDAPEFTYYKATPHIQLHHSVAPEGGIQEQGRQRSQRKAGRPDQLHFAEGTPGQDEEPSADQTHTDGNSSGRSGGAENPFKIPVRLSALSPEWDASSAQPAVTQPVSTQPAHTQPVSTQSQQAPGPVAESFHDSPLQEPLVPGDTKSRQGSNDTNNSSQISVPMHVPVTHAGGWRRRLNRLVVSRRFELFFTSVIILNAINMGLQWYMMPDELDLATNYINYAFTLCFVIEMILKLAGLGVGGYVSEGMNIFDGFVTIAGLVEMIIDLTPAQGSMGSYLSVLRAFRLLRVFRLARSWKSLNRIIKVLLSSIAAVSWLTGLLILFMFICALLGSQFFGYKLATCSTVDRSFQACPPGLNQVSDCPAVWDCYVPCNASVAGQWFSVDNSPYGGMAFCEQFPRDYDASAPDNDPSWPLYLAQVGHPDHPETNFDTFYDSFMSIFQLVSLDNWSDMMHRSMARIASATALFFVVVILVGCYMLLNLFLAIILDNLDQISERNLRSVSSTNLDGGSMDRMASRTASEAVFVTMPKEQAAVMMQGIEPLAAGPVPMERRKLKKVTTLNATFYVPAGQTDLIGPLAAARQKLENHMNKRRVAEEEEDEELGMHGPRDGSLIKAGIELTPSRAQSLAEPAQADSNAAAEQPEQQSSDQPAAMVGLSPKPGKVRLMPLETPATATGDYPLNSPAYRISGTHLEAIPPRGSLSELSPLAANSPIRAGLAASSGRSPLPPRAGGIDSVGLRSPRAAPPPAPPDPPAPCPPAPDTQDSTQDSLRRPLSPGEATEEASTSTPAITPGKPGYNPASVPMRPSTRQGPEQKFSVQRTNVSWSLPQNPPYTIQHQSSGLGAVDDRLASRSSTRSKRDLSRPGTADGDSRASSHAGIRNRRASYVALRHPGELQSEASVAHSLVSRMASTVDPMVLGAPVIGEGERPGLRVRDFLHGSSLFIFSPRNPVRVFLAQVVANKWFEQFVMLLILASSIQLALDSYAVQPGSQMAKALYVMDIIFCITFGLELVFKVIVFGLAFNGPGSYLRSPWNVLDALIVAVQIVVLVVEAVMGPDGLAWLQAFRALRSLRPLRAASRIEGIKIVVSATLRAIPALGDVVLVGLLFYYIFSVLAVNLLMGSMYYCADSSGNMLDATLLLPEGQTINKTWCEQGTVTVDSSYYHDSINQSVPQWNMTVTWTSNLPRFDNVPMALWTLFQVASLEGWSDIMHQAQAAVGPDEQPVENHNPYMGLFFVVFVVIGSYIMLNLVIGVSIDKFNQMKEKEGKSPLLTDAQTQWLSIQKLLTATQLSRRWTPPTQNWRRAVYAVTHGTPYFDNAMLVVILANVATMCMVHADGGPAWDKALSIANAVFSGIFLVEMLLKWVAVGVQHYFQDNWNRFDSIVVVLSVIGVILDYTSPQQLTLLPLLRIMRVARIVRVIPKARGLRLMLTTLLWSLPALLNVASMLFLFLFIYSIIGMNLFGNIMFQENISRHANFRTFPAAILTLFRCITGENWNSLMTDCMVRQNCVLIKDSFDLTFGNGTVISLVGGNYLDPVDNADIISQAPSGLLENQCSILPFAAVLFFCSFMLLCSYLLLQLVIAVVIDNIQNQYAMEEMVIHQEHIWAFTDAWETLDTQGTGFIGAHQLTTLLEAVPPPLGVLGLDYPSKRVLDKVLEVDVAMHDMKVHFLETLHALAGAEAGAELPHEEELALHNELLARLPKEATSSKYTAGHYYCALYVKAAIKGFLARRMISPLWEALDAREELDRKSRNGLVKIASKPLGFNSIAKLSPEQRRAILDGMTDAVDVGDSFGRAKSSTAAALSMLPLTRRTSQTTPPTEWPTLAASQAHIQTSQDGRPREDSAESALSHT